MSFRIDNAVLTGYISSLGFADAIVPQTLRLIGLRGGIVLPDGSISLQGDDLIHYQDTIGYWGTAFKLFRGTTIPGIFYTQHPDNPKGAAHLLTLEDAASVDGVKPWSFRRGLHHGDSRNPCLIQNESFIVRRDANRDGVAGADEPLDKGDFGIHIHHGGMSADIGVWSAGCQVIWGGNASGSPWDTFFQDVLSSGQHSWLYFLIDAQALAKFLGLV